MAKCWFIIALAMRMTRKDLSFVAESEVYPIFYVGTKESAIGSAYIELQKENPESKEWVHTVKARHLTKKELQKLVDSIDE
ncbi:MAG: hypothetical protein KGI50_00875 [Patescibacteria group bacterium]|nr:hypothetical protein [Patescibacteria group bacterium]MDE2438093.1 hypothetical protein [Patescibacteria group bacterium]